MVLTNKHVVIAMIVAPVLAVIAWFATGQWVGEKPRVSVAGQSYPLLEKSNCRYPSGTCDLVNEDMRLRLSASLPNDRKILLTASHPLDGVMFSAVFAGRDEKPKAMLAVDGEGLKWAVTLEHMPAAARQFRLVAATAGSQYFAEAGTAFLQNEDN